MNLTLEPEQQAIADLAARLFAGKAGWDALVEAGFPALLLPAERGGSGLGFVELALILVEQGRARQPAPLWRHAVAAHAAATAGIDLPAGARLTLALDASLVAASDRLSGLVPVLATAATSSHAVLATADAAWLVALDAAGFAQQPGTLTNGEPASALTLTAAPARRLALPGNGADWLRARAALCLVALQLGVAAGALAETARYVTQREQFGRPIGSFQAVGHRAADGFTDIEVVRTLMLELAWKLDAGVAPGTSADIALYWANQCSHRVAHTATHLHGGMGADISYPIHQALLWARALELELGGAARQLARIGDRLAEAP